MFLILIKVTIPYLKSEARVYLNRVKKEVSNVFSFFFLFFWFKTYTRYTRRGRDAANARGRVSDEIPEGSFS